MFNRRAKILSFEPNPAQQAMLRGMKILLGRRFDYRMIGLGDAPGGFPLFVPQVGKLSVSTRASLQRNVIEEYIAEQPAKQQARMAIREVQVQVETLDSQDLAPSFVKIDVEGAEHLVLGGMTKTLARHRPVVMLEVSESKEQATAILRDHGYEIFALSADQQMVRFEDANWEPLNMFALHGGSGSDA